MPIRPENKGRYPLDWPQLSNWIKFERAKSQCECEGECGRPAPHEGRCDSRHREVNPRTKAFVWLTTAHLDHTPENCDPANLKAMCQQCHNGYDKDHRTQTKREVRAAERAAWMTPLFVPPTTPEGA